MTAGARGAGALLAAAALVAGATAQQPSPPAPSTTAAERFPLGAAAPPAPRIRVGLRSQPDQVRVGSSSGPFRILDARSGAEVCSDRVEGPVLLAPRGGRPAGAAKIFRVQVGAFRNETTALDEARRFEGELRVPVDIVRDPARGVLRLRVGGAERASDLQALLATLRAAGYGGAFITSEARTAPRATPAELLALDSAWQTCATGADRVVVVAGADARATVDGRPYRGLIEVALSSANDVSVVNALNVEDYLLGVVPEELGPELFPEIEALKAQAVAARTYAIANLGQYAEQGYDLCDTPRCQVYGGAASEHPRSTQAVRETAGEVLVYESRPIAALFTSTCGGRTEDVGAVFPEMAVAGPYLRGVECRPPGDVLDRRLIRVTGRAPAGAWTSTNLAIPRLEALDVLPREALDDDWSAKPVQGDEVSRWAAALARAAGRPPAPAFGDVPTRLEVWRHLGAVLGFTGDGEGLVAPGDENLVLPADERAEIPPGDRLWLANLLARDLAPSAADSHLAPFEPATRRAVIDFLARAADALAVGVPREATVRGRAKGGLLVRERGGASEIAVDARVALAAETAGRWRPVTALELLPGDRLLVIFPPGAERPALLGLRERTGGADDRASPKSRWVVSRDREFIERRLVDWAPVGRLLDVVVVRRGSSGRVAEVELRGDEGVARVDGFQLRTAFDLPETLFRMEMQRDADGAVRRIDFVGRGWGHGVGLCQYGAVGMAERGADYREILAHYYTGVVLARAYGEAP